MEAIDTNILVYAHRAESEYHDAAFALLKRLSQGDALWAIPCFCLTEFVRVVTHPSIYQKPTSPSLALAAIQKLTQSPSLQVLYPGDRFLPLFADFVTEGAAGNLVFDAQIAAVCLERGASLLWTYDRDFTRFTEFRVKRPL